MWLRSILGADYRNRPQYTHLYPTLLRAGVRLVAGRTPVLLYYHLPITTLVQQRDFDDCRRQDLREVTTNNRVDEADSGHGIPLGAEVGWDPSREVSLSY